MILRAGQEEDVAREVARLFQLDRQACLALWRGRIGQEVPKHLSLPLMQRILAYDLQAAAFGGLPNKTFRALRAATAGASSRPRGRIAPGARLVREWNGRTFEVEVLVDGFAWKWRRFRSLSPIAREITGTRWSGPRFFGVGS